MRVGAGFPAQTPPGGAQVPAVPSPGRPWPESENPVNPVPSRGSRADNRGVHHGHDREGVER